MSGPSKDFLLDPGTNGFIATPFNLMTTELNGLTNTSTATSSVGGTSGVFTQASFNNSLDYAVIFTGGGSFTPTAGAMLLGWWLESADGGATFEFGPGSTTGLPGAPDLIVPLDVLAWSSSNQRFGLLARAPWTTCKLFIQNLAGVTLPSSGNILRAGPVGWGY